METKARRTFIFFLNRVGHSFDKNTYGILRDYSIIPGCSSLMKEYVTDYNEAEVGDKAFFVLLHYWYKGICATGTIVELTEEDGHGYAEIELTKMIDYEHYPVLPLQELMDSIPDFDWKEAPEGSLLKEKDAALLDSLWNDYILSLEKNEKSSTDLAKDENN